MDATYLNSLPADVQALVENIEEMASVDIAIDVNPAKPHLSCKVTEHGAQIIIPTADHFPDSSVLHELLHIRRILVEGVPQISYGDDDWPSPEEEDFLNAIDNNLEHLVIVSEELGQRPQAQAQWEDKMAVALDSLEAHSFPQNGHNALALLCFAFIYHVLRNNELLARAKVVVDEAGLSEHPAHLFNNVSPANQTKEDTTRLFFQLLGLPTQGIYFEYFDSRTHTRRLVPLVEPVD